MNHLVEGFAKAGLKPLRVTSGSAVKDSIAEHSLEFKLQKHPLYPDLQDVVKQEDEHVVKIAGLESKIQDIQDKGQNRLVNRLDNMRLALVSMRKTQAFLRSKRYGIKQQMLRDVINDADVVREFFTFCFDDEFQYHLFTDLHNLCYIGFCPVECDRLSNRLHR